MALVIPQVMKYDYPSVVNVLKTPVKICKGYRHGIDPTPASFEYQALWDTGATGTSITKEVIGMLGLKPVTQIEVFNAHGESKIKDAFLVNITFPCNIMVNGITAAEGSFGSGIGVLVGMDIIRLGDFAISNFKGKTAFSFRIPTYSKVELDPPMLGRNDPCPCGSGMKYKKCHWAEHHPGG